MTAAADAVSTDWIPLVDLEPWFDGSDDARAVIAEQVDAHLRRCGFLVVINHRLPDDVVDTCREQARAFFHQPAEVKQEVAMAGPAYTGWVGPGLESNAATYGIDTPPDLKETYGFGPVDVADDTLRQRFPHVYPDNRWPSSVPGLQPAAEAWWRSARELHDHLLDVLSLALDLPLTHLRDLSTSPTANVSMNWYGPRDGIEPAANQFRVGPHTDFGLLTVLSREPGLGGLQVLDEAGNWIDAPFVPGGLTINTGDLVRRWTNDRWCSNQHRVLPPPAERPEEELISLVYFGEPDADAMVESFESCVSEEHPAKYPPIQARAYLDAKMAALAVGT